MKVLTFGEIMLRLKAPGHERFFQSPSLEAARQTWRCHWQTTEWTPHF